MRIVGVVQDAAYRSLRDPAPPTLYTPYAQSTGPTSSVAVSIRAGVDPLALSKSIGSVVASLDRDLSITFRSLSDQVDAALVQERLLAILSGFFGALALLLAGLGLYGVTAHAVNRRRVEMGIRLALGATPGAVVRLVFSRVSLLVGLGVAIGAAASYWAGAFVATLTYGVESRDPRMLLAAGLVLAVTGAVAAWLPARRASRLDPARVLHDS
jgi:ABC-type antimicrobial peptide transport system permease subunit